MKNEYTRRELEEFRTEMEKLPIGYISRKIISGKEYFYRQWAEDGKTKSKYVKKQELALVRSQIARRKELQAILKESEEQGSGAQAAAARKPEPLMLEFETNVQTGVLLDRLLAGAEKLPRRQLVGTLLDYLRDQMDSRICILHGLRRTGKTVMMFHAIGGLGVKERGRSAYIRVAEGTAPGALVRDIQKLAAMDFHFIFLDEMASVPDFPEVVELLSDVYGSMGIKIVAAGMAPPHLCRAIHDTMFDRIFVLRTTGISFWEHERASGGCTAADYMRWGGMLQTDGVLKKEAGRALPEREFADAYIHNVICQNMGGRQSEVVREVIREINDSLVLSFFSRNFKLYNWGGTLRRGCGAISCSEEERAEAVKYLEELELITYYPFFELAGGKPAEKRMLFNLKWIRHIQVKKAVEILMGDVYFAGLSGRDKKSVHERMLSGIMEYMGVELVVAERLMHMPASPPLETVCVRRPGSKAASCDLIVHDTRSDECWMYAVRLLDKPDKEAEASMLDEGGKREIEAEYGRIIDRCILYPGAEKWMENGIHYQNIEQYLRGLV